MTTVLTLRVEGRDTGRRMPYENRGRNWSSPDASQGNARIVANIRK